MPNWTQKAEGEYLAAFWATFSKERASALFDRARMLPSLGTRASYHTRQEHRPLHLVDVPAIYGSQGGDNPGPAEVVIVIESIDLCWIDVLGRAMDIVPSFFAGHASNPVGSPPWQAIFSTSPMERKRPRLEQVPFADSEDGLWDKAHFWHVDGIYSCKRRTLVSPKIPTEKAFLSRLSGTSGDHGIYTSTRISFWHSSNKFRSLCKYLISQPYCIKSS